MTIKTTEEYMAWLDAYFAELWAEIERIAEEDWVDIDDVIPEPTDE